MRKVEKMRGKNAENIEFGI